MKEAMDDGVDPEVVAEQDLAFAAMEWALASDANRGRTEARLRSKALAIEESLWRPKPEGWHVNRQDAAAVRRHVMQLLWRAVSSPGRYGVREKE